MMKSVILRNGPKTRSDAPEAVRRVWSRNFRHGENARGLQGNQRQAGGGARTEYHVFSEEMAK